ncbi:MAG: hypothetical protein R3200_10530, partial [Xanthomonadales bacterium]|nr:hypothetical protein [Xanthomonadales bacterium]
MDPEALAEMMQAGTRSVAAYTSLLKAYAAQQDVIADGSYEMGRAIEFIEQAREQDPNFSQAHAAAALMYRGLSQSTDMRSQYTESGDEYWERF